MSSRRTSLESILKSLPRGSTVPVVDGLWWYPTSYRRCVLVHTLVPLPSGGFAESVGLKSFDEHTRPYWDASKLGLPPRRLSTKGGLSLRSHQKGLFVRKVLTS